MTVIETTPGVWHDQGVVRPALLLLTLLATASMLSGCDSRFAGLRISLATGSSAGVYYALGQPLADQWGAQLGIDRPDVQQTAGSPDNLRRLRAGTADVAFSAADVAEENTEAGPRKLRALARIYDDYIHLVVRADGPIKQVSDLRGRRVSVGSLESGVEVIAKRVLAVARLDGVVTVSHDSLDASSAALMAGHIDAFFWSGGLPTSGITALANKTRIRLIDLTPVLAPIRKEYPIYGTASIPASTYRLSGGPVTTLVVPNLLVVTDTMSDAEAQELVRGVFLAQDKLVKANDAALSIDIHSAIDTAAGAPAPRCAAVLPRRQGLNPGQAHRHREAATLGQAQLHRPVDPVDHAPHDREPQPRSRHVLVRRAAPEPVRRPLQLVRLQPGPVITHRQRQPVVLGTDLDADLRLRRAELQGVVQQRVQDRLQPARGQQHTRARRHRVHRKPDALLPATTRQSAVRSATGGATSVGTGSPAPSARAIDSRSSRVCLSRSDSASAAARCSSATSSHVPLEVARAAASAPSTGCAAGARRPRRTPAARRGRR